MSSLIAQLKKKMKPEELHAAASLLNTRYEPWRYSKTAWDTITELFPKDICDKFRTQMTGYQAANEIIMNLYPGEKVVKYHLIKQYLNIKDEVSLFEYKIDNSRLDVGRINGQSYAYEIKTKLDSLDRLEKQLEDYSKVFEKIYVILDEKHLEKTKQILPTHCGIIQYAIKRNKCLFKTIQEASFSPYIDPEAQIRNLPTKELAFVLRKMGMKEVPNVREEREKEIRARCHQEQLNELFKLAVKKKFQIRWNYICKNFDRIQPVDVQFFFNYSPYIDPENIYSY